MKTIIRLGILWAALFTAHISNAQIWDGHLVLNTGDEIAAGTNYPSWFINMLVLPASVRQIVNGNVLVGDNLGNTVTLGLDGLAAIDVTWKYSALKMDDGSGVAILLNMSIASNSLGSSIPISRSKIMLTPSEVAARFLDENALIILGLNSSGFLYYRFSNGNPYGLPFSSFRTPLNNSPYYTWANFDPFSGISVGEPIFIDFLP